MNSPINTDVQITPESVRFDADVPLEQIPPHKLTEKQRKELMRKYFTVRHPRSIVCEHRIDLSREPRHQKCEYCWFAFFNNNPALVGDLDDVFRLEGGAQVIRAARGKRFLKHFVIFMASVNEVKRRMENQLHETVDAVVAHEGAA